MKIIERIKSKLKRELSNELSCGTEYLKQQQTNFPHPIGITIGRGVELGMNCTVYQNVTIGAKTVEDSTDGVYPKIGNDVIIGASALIIGDIKIGNNAYIGAGAVVIKDVCNNATVVGNPAREI